MVVSAAGNGLHGFQALGCNFRLIVCNFVQSRQQQSIDVPAV